MTSADLDLRGLHVPRPDPGFVDALEQRLQAIVTDETTSTTDAPAVEDDPVVDLYASRNAERPAHRRWIIRTASGSPPPS